MCLCSGTGGEEEGGLEGQVAGRMNAGSIRQPSSQW
jgi:hypothetical protein